MTKSNRNTRRGVQNVRMIDPMAGTDGLKVDKQLAAIHSSSNHVQVLCSGYNDLSSTAAEQVGNISWSQIALFDDFTSLSQQFNTYRIRSIRFDVYDIAPNVTSAGLFSTFHDQFTAGTQPVFSFGEVVDGSDASYIPPGTGKISFSWVGHTLNEKGYYDVNPAGEAPRNDFGGLRFVIPANSASLGTKYRVVTKAIVDFRGRR